MDKKEFVDKKIVCRDCQKEFVFSRGEQEFFDKKGLQNIPTRCADCRKQFREKKEKGELEAQIKCTVCESMDKVPFAPRHQDGVFCEDCFRTKFKNLASD